MCGGEGGGTAVGGGQDNLARVLFPQISDCEYTVHVGFAFFIRDHIAIRIGVGSRRNQLVVGNKTNKYKNAIGLYLTGPAGVDVFYIHGTNFVPLGFNRRHNRVPVDFQY